MTTARPGLGPEVGASGDGPRATGESVVRAITDMRTYAKHKPRSLLRHAESAANEGDRAVYPSLIGLRWPWAENQMGNPG